MFSPAFARDLSIILESRPPPGVSETLRLDGARLCFAPGHDGAFPSSNPNFAEVALRGETPATDRADALIDAFKTRSIPHFFVWVVPSADNLALMEHLVLRGGRAWAQCAYPVLVRALSPARPETPSPFTIHRADSSLLNLHAPALADIHEGNPHRAPALTRHAARPDATILVAFADDRPIAVASLFIHHQLEYLADAATHPDFRKRGAQRALIAERLRLAVAAGCTTAASETLSVLSHSLSNLRWAGFTEAFSWVVVEFGTESAGPTR